MATPAELLAQSLAKLQTANRIDGNKNSYKKDNGTEYAKVIAYLQGGARPIGVTTDMGVGLMLEEDARRGLLAGSSGPTGATGATGASGPGPTGATGASGPPLGLGVDRATMLATGGTILRDDSSAQADPLTGLWGQLAAQDPSRHVHKTSGGDPRPRGDGSAQGNNSYRELTVMDGDSWQGESSERTELGRNTTTPYYTECKPGSVDGTFGIFDEGEHKIVFFSQRYHPNFDLTLNTFQVIFQLKQNQPYAANGPVDTAPALALDIYFDGTRPVLLLENFWNVLWSTAAPVKGQWIRYALDVTFSKDPSKGKIQVFADVDGDGDFTDPVEMSPVFTCQTLANLTSKGSSPRNVGDAIPSHMRMGIYHRATYATTTIDIDNIQVIG